MKVTVNVPPQRDQVTLPSVRRNVVSDAVVLFTSTTKGVIINCPRDPSKVGDVVVLNSISSSCWVPCSITLDSTEE